MNVPQPLGDATSLTNAALVRTITDTFDAAGNLLTSSDADSSIELTSARNT